MIKVGDKIRINKSEGFVTKILGNYCLIKFKSGQFSFNMLSIKPEQIIEQQKKDLQKAIAAAEKNLSKITDVDKHVNECKGYE